MDPDISNLTLRAVRRILRAIETGNRKLASATGLTPSQLLVLREIEARDRPTPSVIANALQFSQATISAIVDRLVALGFVERQRDEKDKRQVILRCRDNGRAALDAAPDVLQLDFRERFDALESWEQAMILAAVERLSTILDAQDIDAAPLLDSGVIDR